MDVSLRIIVGMRRMLCSLNADVIMVNSAPIKGGKEGGGKASSVSLLKSETT